MNMDVSYLTSVDVVPYNPLAFYSDSSWGQRAFVILGMKEQVGDCWGSAGNPPAWGPSGEGGRTGVDCSDHEEGVGYVEDWSSDGEDW